MTNTTLKTQINTVLLHLTNNNKLFTAFDVTNKLRESGVTCFHSDVKKEVHESFSGTDAPLDYTRTQMQMPNGKVAFVYHPSTIDASEYDTDNVDNDSSVVVAVNKVNSDDCFSRDRRGRLCIPKKLLYKINVDPFGPVSVDASNKTKVVVREGRHRIGNLYFADKDGNVRISPKLLSGLSNQNENKIVVEMGEIVIE